MKKKELLSELIENKSPIEEAFHLLPDSLLQARYSSTVRQYNLGLISFEEKEKMVAKIWYDLLEKAYQIGTRADYDINEVYTLHLIDDKWYVQLDPITTFLPTTRFEAERIKPLLTKSNDVLWIKNPDIQKNPIAINSKGEEKPVKHWLSFFKTKNKREDHLPWG